MMQNQQAAMASLLDTQMAVANAAAARAASPEIAPATTNPQQAAAAPASANGKRAVRAQHSHKPKTADRARQRLIRRKPTCRLANTNIPSRT
ncbi:MAG: cell wall surface anchor family protein [uncultured Paraburkholderia sp.]|nr:MAG: cell wall surface anchor family protein [uncultured Paraburkholderia sp.]